MSVVLLTGDHPRHAQLARAVAATGRLAGLVIERREPFVPEQPPAECPPATRALHARHFALRAEAEQRHFGAPVLPDVPRLDVTAATLNDQQTARFATTLAPDLVLSYGVHRLSEATLERLAGAQRWNVHGGLSPWYRGVATHFWPSYLLEPQCTGMTVHLLTNAIDGGAVVHQSVAALQRGDGLHDLACRAVLSLTGELDRLLEALDAGRLAEPTAQATSGRIWRSRDWQPAHLHLIYDHYGDRIVDHYLDGAFAGQRPALIRQFA